MYPFEFGKADYLIGLAVRTTINKTIYKSAPLS